MLLKPIVFHLLNQAWLGQLSIEPVFGWAAAIPLAIIMLASLWLTLTSRGISPGRRWILAALRLVAVAVLLAGWLRPAVVTTSQRESAGAIAVLMDRSESMKLPGGSQRQTRWDIQQDVWSSIVSATSLNIGQTELVPYFYDSQVAAAPGDALPSLNSVFSTPPSGRLTDLGEALSEIGRLQLDPPLRGVILMGDFTQTLRPPPVNPVTAARQMAQLDQPILVVGIGSQNESQMRDVAIEGLPEEISAFAKKSVRVPLVVSSVGMVGQELQVSLVLKASGKQDQIVASRTVVPSAAKEKLPIEFDMVIPDTGDYLLQAAVSADPRLQEQSTGNNEAFGFVTVREGGVRILYLEGEVRAEMTFLRRSMDESLEFEVDMPRELLFGRKAALDLTRRYDVSQYDAIIIGDLPARALSKATQEAIRKQVEQGGAGLLLMGGFQSFSAGGYANSPMVSLFPVALEPGAQADDKPIDPRFHLQGEIQLRPTRSHPITRLDANAPDNERIWAGLDPMNQMNRLGEVLPRPGSFVLLESNEGQAALVVGIAGKGRVMAFAPDTTWRWRMNGNKKIHQQFWRQAMLWLVRKDSLDEGFRLTLERRRLALGEAPPLRLEWVGGTDNHPMPSTVKLELSREGAWLQDLASSKTSGSARESSLPALAEPGLYKVALTATNDVGKVFTTEVAFVVSDQSLELANPSMDAQLASSIADANRAAGGQQVLPEDIDDALAWLRQRQDATKVTTIEKRRLGDAAWDAWLYLVLFSVVMCLEWSLRKKWQLP